MTRPEAERVATRLGVRLVIVSNGGLRPSANPLVEMVYVPDGPDEADKWIAERAGRGDVVVTADIPLAAKCVEAGARVLKHDGEALVMLIRRDNHDRAEPIKHKRIQD